MKKLIGLVLAGTFAVNSYAGVITCDQVATKSVAYGMLRDRGVKLRDLLQVLNNDVERALAVGAYKEGMRLSPQELGLASEFACRLVAN
jgi:hypothetical protein